MPQPTFRETARLPRSYKVVPLRLYTRISADVRPVARRQPCLFHTPQSLPFTHINEKPLILTHNEQLSMDPARHKYYVYSQQENAFVYQDGERVPTSYEGIQSLTLEAQMERNETLSYPRQEHVVQSKTRLRDSEISHDSSDDDDDHDYASNGQANKPLAMIRNDFRNALLGNVNAGGGSDERTIALVARIAYVDVSDESKPAVARLDTGADYNFVLRVRLEEWGIHHQIAYPTASEIAVTLGDGTHTKVRGEITLNWHLRGGTHIWQSNFFILDTMPYDMIIGVRECVERKLISFNLPDPGFGALTSTLSKEEKQKLMELERQAKEKNKKKSDKELRQIAKDLKKSQADQGTSPGSSSGREL
ncbi:hypothetical protein NA57DRAFT_51518 [Rhizodiscina lignyota]|uniref:Uncharacterized protein n=1 Tax=Rhizodiscina lignyota TaxID=1504668 RepID=A0A9P4MBT4_9PEZI|nr:hypothetical protein NA57DRAFT_51518 [Rhizodiscina lignyota]